MTSGLRIGGALPLLALDAVEGGAADAEALARPGHHLGHGRGRIFTLRRLIAPATVLATECKDLDKAVCQRDPACIWIDPYKPWIKSRSRASAARWSRLMRPTTTDRQPPTTFWPKARTHRRPKRRPELKGMSTGRRARVAGGADRRDTETG